MSALIIAFCQQISSSVAAALCLVVFLLVFKVRIVCDQLTDSLRKKENIHRGIFTRLILTIFCAAKPKITDSNLQDKSQYESLDVSYIVKGTANPPPTATWSVDGKVIKPNSNLRMTVSESGEEFHLDIKKLDMKDAGVYQCVLSNPLGEAKQQAKLDVIRKIRCFTLQFNLLIQ